VHRRFSASSLRSDAKHRTRNDDAIGNIPSTGFLIGQQDGIDLLKPRHRIERCEQGLLVRDRQLDMGGDDVGDPAGVADLSDHNVRDEVGLTDLTQQPGLERLRQANGVPFRIGREVRDRRSDQVRRVGDRPCADIVDIGEIAAGLTDEAPDRDAAVDRSAPSPCHRPDG
jgi:hypothetical protein